MGLSILVRFWGYAQDMTARLSLKLKKQSPPNQLRMFRRRSPLTQKDIAFLVQTISHSNISAIELGKIRAWIELLLVYHLLFNTSVESLFELICRTIQPTLVKNTQNLLTEIKQQLVLTKEDSHKLVFLEDVIERLRIA